MTRARIISRDGVEDVSGREFYTRAFGHAPRTRAELEAEWNADCERYADMIEAGSEWAVPRLVSLMHAGSWLSGS
jgi:hypothetical protein